MAGEQVNIGEAIENGTLQTVVWPAVQGDLVDLVKWWIEHHHESDPEEWPVTR
jgi:hypothetical protein